MHMIYLEAFRGLIIYMGLFESIKNLYTLVFSVMSFGIQDRVPQSNPESSLNQIDITLIVVDLM